MKLRLILGDQLTPAVSSLSNVTKGDLILMCEVRQEATYAKHHKKKIAFIFSAMRHFAQGLAAQGLNVRYVAYDDAHNTGSLLGEVKKAIDLHDFDELIVTKPGEYRLLSEFEAWADQLLVPVTLREDDRFLCTTEDFAHWANGRKQMRMEYFLSLIHI